MKGESEKTKTKINSKGERVSVIKEYKILAGAQTRGTGMFREKTKRRNSVALVRERTIPTERTPRVGEVSANFLPIKDDTWSV
jgi:hypothetical protein